MKEPNQPLQRNASTWVRLKFRVASSAWLTRDRSAKRKAQHFQFMDYQRLSRILLRVLGIWLTAQSLVSVIGGLIQISHMSTALKETQGAVWAYPIMSGLSLLLGLGLLVSSASYLESFPNKT